MQIISNILYIILFVVCLSVLIVVHELGHLAAAKAFGVYCNEFSIGFGPKLFSHKRKNGETAVSVRCIPFGGYVSMYGEGMEVPEGKEIPKERAFDHVKPWKRAIILVAGVTMNALLALTAFFSYECFFPKTELSASICNADLDPTKNTAAYRAGMNEETIIALYETNLDHVYGVDAAAIAHHKNGEEETVYAVIDGSNVLGYDKLSWGYYLHFCYATDGEISYEASKQLKVDDTIEYVQFAINEVAYSEVDKGYKPTGNKWTIQLTTKVQQDKNETYYVFEDAGLYINSSQHYNKNFGQTIKNTFVDFGEGSVAIVTGFVKMFTTKEGFESAGSLIAIANETTNILKNYGWANFIRVWGLISVNLAIVNLFPFPGLDGWQLLVLIVEGVAHKEIPKNVKGIISLIGIGLLFVFMIFMLFKDAFIYIF